MPSYLGLWDKAPGSFFGTRVAASEFIDVESGTFFAPTLAPGIDASDFNSAAKVLFEMADFVQSVEVPLEAAKEIARRDMAERFETETAPNGRAWVALNEEYEVWKQEEYGDLPILTLTSDLKDSALDESSWSVSGDSVWFNTGHLPDYWAAHQYGVGDISFTPTGGINAGEYFEIFKGTPARPYIGLSNEAESEIISMLDAWMDTGMKSTKTRYKVGSRVMSGGKPGVIGANGRVSGRGFGGRFGPKIT